MSSWSPSGDIFHRRSGAFSITMRPASASPVLRMKFLAMLSALVLAAGALCRAEEPSLSVYQIIPGDSENPRGELIMKLNNPPGRTYYLYTPGITSFLAAIEVQ